MILRIALALDDAKVLSKPTGEVEPGVNMEITNTTGDRQEAAVIARERAQQVAARDREEKIT